MKLHGIVIITLVVTANLMAGFAIDFHNISIDNDQKIASFQLGFTSAPNFWTTNTAGFQANGFQYLIDFDKDSDYPGDAAMETVIRGEEIHSWGFIPVRDILGPPPADPGSGGYGLIRGLADFDLTGNVLSFSVDLATIGDTDGLFSYAIMTTEYGQMTDWEYSDNPYKPFEVVPTPSAILLTSIGVLAVRFVRRKA